MLSTMNNLSCLILAGGKGKRLKPLTNLTPKPLIKVSGRSIVDYVIEHCSTYKIKDFFVLSGYLSERVEEHFRDYPASKNIKVINTGDVDIIERIKSVKEFLRTDYFLILYGDTISDVNIANLLEFHVKSGKLATITTWELVSNFGVIKSNKDSIVQNYLEKPKLDIWINIGYIILSKECFSHMDDFSCFENFLTYMVNERNMVSFKHHGMHLTINNIHELNIAEEKLKNINFTI